MSFGAIGGAVASTVVGSALSRRGGGSGGSTEVQQSANPFMSDHGDFFAQLDSKGNAEAYSRGNTGILEANGISDARDFAFDARNNRGADTANSLGNEMLDGIDAFDPMSIARQQFDLFNPILQEGFEDDRLSQENRQFSQGRLGSTGGANDVNALLDSQRDSERKLLFDSFGQGMAAQGQQIGNASSLLQLDPQLRGMFQNLGSNSLNNSLNINDQSLDRFNAFAAAQGGNSVSTTRGGSTTSQVGNGLINAGVNQLGKEVGGLFAPSPASRPPLAHNYQQGGRG